MYRAQAKNWYDNGQKKSSFIKRAAPYCWLYPLPGNAPNWWGVKGNLNGVLIVWLLPTG